MFMYPFFPFLVWGPQLAVLRSWLFPYGSLLTKVRETMWVPGLKDPGELHAIQVPYQLYFLWPSMTSYNCESAISSSYPLIFTNFGWRKDNRSTDFCFDCKPVFLQRKPKRGRGFLP